MAYKHQNHIREVGGHKPSIPDSAFVAFSASVIGDVTLGEECSVWYNAVIRGDSNQVTIGSQTNIQDGAVLHEDEDSPLHIGSRVAIGHSAVVHGCEIGDNVLIGMGAVILSGAHIGGNCIIGAGSLVTGKQVIPDGSLAFGNPAKVIRPLTEAEREEILGNVERYRKQARRHRQEGLDG